MISDPYPPEEGADSWKREIINWLMDLAKQQTEILNAINELKGAIEDEGK